MSSWNRDGDAEALGEAAREAWVGRRGGLLHLLGPELMYGLAAYADDLLRHPVGDGEDAVPGLPFASPTGGIQILAGVVGFCHTTSLPEPAHHWNCQKTLPRDGAKRSCPSSLQPVPGTATAPAACG